MINVKITDNAIGKARKYQIKKKFDKQTAFLEKNPRHNSLDFKPLEGQKKDGIWRFRVDDHYWGLVIKTRENTLEVYNVIKHP